MSQGGAGDLGVDIRCHDQDGNLVVVQCKRYAPDKRIGSPAIQHLMAMALHHGARHKIFVTTASYTMQAIALAKDAGVELIDGKTLAELVGQPQLVTISPTPDAPAVLPDFYTASSSYAALTAYRAWLEQLHPETPVIRPCKPITREQERDGPSIRSRLFALAPEQFRKALLLYHVAWMGERDRPGICLLENENSRIKDYVVMMGQPHINRCHHGPVEHMITAEDIHGFILLAETMGYGIGAYKTSGLFTAGALLLAAQSPYVSTRDGWEIACDLVAGRHGVSGAFEGRDFIVISQQPDWPKKILEGTERLGILGRLFR